MRQVFIRKIGQDNLTDELREEAHLVVACGGKGIRVMNHHRSSAKNLVITPRDCGKGPRIPTERSSDHTDPLVQRAADDTPAAHRLRWSGYDSLRSLTSWPRNAMGGTETLHGPKPADAFAHAPSPRDACVAVYMLQITVWIHCTEYFPSNLGRRTQRPRYLCAHNRHKIR